MASRAIMDHTLDEAVTRLRDAVGLEERHQIKPSADHQRQGRICADLYRNEQPASRPVDVPFGVVRSSGYSEN
jgi:hypothetical protein